ncbi:MULTISPECIES: nuclease [Sphingobium]|uniref:Nuclease n=2 Tax=Sphingobium TaxID=165695 RepID=A0A9X7YF58_SPHYA|nr:nuclease [Sphingobium yanoikuyae]QNG48746.1 nuclease [Sphingobium yanoikuyae]
MLTSTTIWARKILPYLAAGFLSLAWVSPARADPCEGALPARGSVFSGEVRYVGDGDGLCLGPEGRPDRWIEVRLGDFFAPELQERGGAQAKSRLAQLVMGRVLVCRAGRRSYDRVIGFCTLAGKPVGDLLRSRGGVEAGRGWR